MFASNGDVFRSEQQVGSTTDSFGIPGCLCFISNTSVTGSSPKPRESSPKPRDCSALFCSCSRNILPLSLFQPTDPCLWRDGAKQESSSPRGNKNDGWGQLRIIPRNSGITIPVFFVEIGLPMKQEQVDSVGYYVIYNLYGQGTLRESDIHSEGEKLYMGQGLRHTGAAYTA